MPSSLFETIKKYLNIADQDDKDQAIVQGSDTFKYWSFDGEQNLSEDDQDDEAQIPDEPKLLGATKGTTKKGTTKKSGGSTKKSGGGGTTKKSGGGGTTKKSGGSTKKKLKVCESPKNIALGGV